MKFNSKILGVLLASLAVLMVISAASAVGLGSDFNNGDVGMKIPKGDYFIEIVNVATEDMNMTVFENSDNSSDVNSIICFKDSTADKKEASGFISDLEKSGNKVEETDKYVILENSHQTADFDISKGFDSVFNFIGSAFSSEGMNVSADGSSVSLSSEGFKVSDASGEKVSITSKGIEVSGDNSSGNASVNVSSDINSNIADCDYSLYLKNSGNSQVVVISGNDLELLKSMAETVKFKEN